MTKTEKQEHKAILRLVEQKSSAAYRSARKANIPVTVQRGDTIYCVTNEGSVAIGKVPPMVKVPQLVVKLK
jgi:hypothetical protein